MQPNGVAGVVGHGVCGVLPPGQALAPQVIRQLGLAAAQQGPPQGAAERAHAGRAAGTGAAGQVHQHRLCLVVHVVGQGDEVRAKLGLEAPQLFIAQPSRRRFQAFPSLARLRRHIQAGAAKRYVQPLAQRPAERGVFRAVRPDAVVDVGGV